MTISKISVVIPCYNSEKTIEYVCDKIRETFSGKYKYEIILVNDCSNDSTWRVLRDLSLQNKNIISLNLSKNCGQHAATMAGFREAKGDYVAGIDDDGEYDAHDFLKLIDELDKGFDYVCGYYPKKKESVFRNLGTRMNNYMTTKLIDKPKEIDLSSLYIMKRFVIDEIIKYDKPFPYIAGLLLRVTSNISNVELEKHERLYGSSGYNLKKLIHLWVNGFTAFSILPLRIASLLGLICSSIGFLYAVYVVIRKIVIVDIPLGYSSLLASIMVIGGLIMLLLGIIGEYIGRIYISLNNTPQYVVKERVSLADENECEKDKVCVNI